jgi:large subunit ribosomal protein L4
VPLWRLDGSAVDADAAVTLHGDVFDAPIRRDLVHRVVRWQLAKRQAGTHAAKDRSEVSGTGKKPHAQKGTGRARAGTRRAPQHRGGGAAHGPRPRSHAHDLQRKVRRAGLVATLSAKLAEGNLVIVDAAPGPDGAKTGALLETLQALSAARGEPPSDVPSFLIVDADDASAAPPGEALRRAAANLPRVHIMPSRGLNVYSILQQRTLVLTAAAAEEVTHRLTRPIKR